MASDVEHLPNWPAPITGVYRLVNERGTRTATRANVTEGKPLPAAPPGYAWRLELQANGTRPQFRRFAFRPAPRGHADGQAAKHADLPANDWLDAIVAAEP
jgi:hypothetical protein